MEQFLEILNSVLENNRLKKIDKLDKNLRLRDDLGLDSLALAELTVKIQYKYGKDIFENSFPETINDVLKILELDGNNGWSVFIWYKI